MIVKGKPRSGPEQLAEYLLRSDEDATVLELLYGDGDLKKAFIDWDAAGAATRGEKTLYHAQIAWETKYELDKNQCLRAVQILAEDLGMGNHPRAVVLHGGHGRPHIHVVFMRTDTETMTMWDDGRNYLKHEKASLRMEQEFGHDIIPGKHAKRDRKRQKDFPRAKLTADEAQYEERSGLSKEQRIAQISVLKAMSENGPAFKAALEQAGYLLAQGERGYIVVDQKGGQSVLTRNVGLKKKELESFMKGVELDKLPTIEEAKEIQSGRRQAVSKVKAAAERAAAEQAPQPTRAHEDLKKLKEELAAMKASADGPKAFKAAVEQAGFIIASGDRGYTLVDEKGEVYNLARQLKLKLAEVNEYMAPVPLASLPTVDQALAIQAERREAVSKSDVQQSPEQPKEKGVEASKFLEGQTTQKQPEPIPAPEDAQLEALKKALAARQAQEVQKWAEYHAHELRTKEHELDIYYRDKLADFDALQQKERDNLSARLAEKRTGIKGIIEAIENRWNPTLAADKAKERRREIAQMKRRQEKERLDYVALQEQSHQLEIENLKERQALREHDEAIKRAGEEERYIREHREAQRLRAEIEAERQHEEELEHNESLRDGPPPPELGKP